MRVELNLNRFDLIIGHSQVQQPAGVSSIWIVSEELNTPNGFGVCRTTSQLVIESNRMVDELNDNQNSKVVVNYDLWFRVVDCY